MAFLVTALALVGACVVILTLAWRIRQRSGLPAPMVTVAYTGPSFDDTSPQISGHSDTETDV
jgi:hypothetical protein